MGIIISWLVLSLAFWITAVILPGFRVRGLGNTLIVAALFGVLNFLLGWFFYTVLAIGTLGLALLLSFITRWIVNAIILKIVDAVSDRLTIDGFGTALWGALLLAIFSGLAEWGLRAMGLLG